MARTKAQKERQRAKRKMYRKEKEIGIGFKNLFSVQDLTPFNANKIIKGGKVEDIILGNNHIYDSVFELGDRLPGSFGVKKGAI